MKTWVDKKTPQETENGKHVKRTCKGERASRVASTHGKLSTVAGSEKHSVMQSGG